MCLLSLRDHCFSLLPTSTLHYYFRFSEIPDSTCLRGGCGRKCSQPRFRFRSTPSHLHLVRFSSILVLFSEPLLHLPRLPLPSCRLIHHDELPRCSRFVLQVGPSRARKALIHIYSSPHVGRYRSTLCACVALRCLAASYPGPPPSLLFTKPFISTESPNTDRTARVQAHVCGLRLFPSESLRNDDVGDSLSGEGLVWLV